MISQKNWEYATEVLHSMDKIARSFNDEDWVEPWLACGVPDGSQTLEAVRDDYPLDECFDEEFNAVSELFCKLIAKQVARIQMPCEGTDFPPSLKFNAKGVIYCGQNIK